MLFIFVILFLSTVRMTMTTSGDDDVPLFLDPHVGAHVPICGPGNVWSLMDVDELCHRLGFGSVRSCLNCNLINPDWTKPLFYFDILKIVSTDPYAMKLIRRHDTVLFFFSFTFFWGEGLSARFHLFSPLFYQLYVVTLKNNSVHGPLVALTNSVYRIYVSFYCFRNVGDDNQIKGSVSIKSAARHANK